MWQEVLNIVISNGIFAVLFVFLLTYLIKDSSKRENKYNLLIKNLSDNLSSAVENKENLSEIKEEVCDVKSDVETNNHLIKQVHDDVKVVKNDVKAIKKIITKKADKKNEKQV